MAEENKYKKHKEYFEIAYRTGTDIWTHLSLKDRGRIFIEKLPKDSLILDVGSGRGFFAKQLAEMNYKVIGLDYEKNIVDKANKEIKNWNLEGKLRFVEGSALDIPFVDDSFDGICDFGLMENLFKEDWEQYATEVNRVLKKGGYYLNTSLSRETPNFFEFKPKNSEHGDFEKYGIHYHFFEKDEIKNIFNHQLTPIEQYIEVIDQPDKIALLETLFQKK
jgi:ubiquinone/menaquinone biosynthesis C-methylase UbiE